MSRKKLEYTAEDIEAYALNAGLTRKKRTRELTDPRFYLFYVLRWEFKWSYAKIGRMFNIKQHKSIINGLDQVESLIDQISFLENTAHVRKRFPCKVGGRILTGPKRIVETEISTKQYNRLVSLQRRKGFKTLGETINHILINTNCGGF